MSRKFLNIVKHFRVGGKLDCVIIQAANERVGADESVYYCFIGTYGKPSKFLAKLAQKVGEDWSRKKATYTSGQGVFCWGGFSAVNEYTVNTLYTYLGWDTDAKGTLMHRMNLNARPPYRRLAADLKRTATDFLALAKSYGTLRVLEFVENINS
jgi:hypothetical protein